MMQFLSGDYLTAKFIFSSPPKHCCTMVANMVPGQWDLHYDNNSNKNNYHLLMLCHSLF